LTPHRFPHVAISGRICSGKSTVAQALVDHYGYTRLSIASPIKILAECARVQAFEYAGHILELICPPGIKLSALAGRYAQLCETHVVELSSGAKPRAFLQDLGLELREYDEDIWINALLRRAADSETPVVVDDLRYWNEAVALRRSHWVLLRCYADEQTLRARRKVLYPGMDAIRLDHPSEHALDDWDWANVYATTSDTSLIPGYLARLIGANPSAVI
jgi:hypothetical protein